MWAALLHRRGQVIALALVSALVVTCAVFAPVFARSIDQALLRVHVTEVDPVTTATAIAQPRSSSGTALLPEQVERLVPDELAAVSATPILAMRQPTEVVPTRGKKPSPVVVRSRSDVCDHLEVAGRCPEAADEVLVSEADALAWGWERGDVLPVPQPKHERMDPEIPDIDLRVVGTYRVVDDPSYWLGDRPDGKSGVPQPDLDNLPGVDDLITAQATFEEQLPTALAVVVLPLDPDTATLDSLPAAADASERLAEEHAELTVDTSPRTIMEGVETGRGQTAVIVPFVMVQLGLLAILVLFLVAQAAVDQRRHDVALARLRGRSRSGARRLLLTELVVPVLLGVPLGVGCALGLAVAVRASMLPAGLPFEVPWPVLLWVLGAVLASVLAVHIAARPVLREPVNDLLRSVRPSAAAGAPVTEVVVVVLAVLGVVGLATGALSGPAALATPTLLAIAVGVLAARLVPRLAARRARSAMRHGNVAAAIAGYGIGRRPAARRVLVVTTVAAAIAIFGANAVVVAGDNRQARAELETGAPAVVSIDASDVAGLVSAADAVEEEGISAAPVAVIRPHDETAEATLATDPDRLREVAFPETTEGLDLDALALPEQQPVRLPGGSASATITWDLAVVGDGEPPTLVAEMTTAGGDARSATLATLGPQQHGSVRVDEPLYCSDDCRLSGLRVATSGSTGALVEGTVTVAGLSVDGTALPVTDADTWVSTKESRTGIDVTTKGEEVTLDVAAVDGADVSTYVADVPRPLPALVSVAGTEQGDTRSVVDVAGGQTEVVVDQTVGALPSVTDRGVVVSLPALARVSGELDVVRTDRQLWLADDSPQTLARVRQVLADDDIAVRSVRTADEADRVYDRSASGWGLQLALFGGVLAVLLAALVLGILAVTGWRASVHDLAALRVSGVGRRAAGRALRTEHLVSVAVGVLLGAVCALVGSWIALPSIPLFTSPAAVPVPDLSPAWSVVGLATLVVAAVLLLVALLLAGAVLRRVRLSAARGEAT